MRLRHRFILRPRPRLRQIVHAQEGVTIVEFALIAPTLLMMLLGAFDVAHTLYMQSVLQGAVQKAARDSSLETAAGSTSTPRDTIDDRVREQVARLHKHAEVDISRRFYRTFSDAAAAQAEPFTDATSGVHKNGICDNGEAYEDKNNNGVWDADGGNAVNAAGARDNVVYLVSVSYPRMFPLDKLIGGNGTTSLTASTVLSNQPYGDQGSDGAPTVGTCPT